MLCPECNHPLLPIEVKSLTQNVQLDYCGSCGGVWTDSGEINFIDEKELAAVAGLLPKFPVHSQIQYNLCPRDRATLAIFKAESIPVNLDVLRCPTCGGLWFPDSNILKFKKAQEVKLNYFKAWNIPLPSIYAILLPAFLLVILGASLFATISGINQGQDIRSRAHDLISKPIILHPAQDQIVINFTTEKDSVTKIKYWINPDEAIEIPVSSTAQKSHTIILRNLEVDKSYSFQLLITEPESIISQVYTFETGK